MRRPDDEPDLFAGLAARDEALALVGANSQPWMTQALTTLPRAVPLGFVGIAEDFKGLLLGAGVGPPHHPNAWGALTRCALDAGLLERTGAWEPMKIVSSHARLSPVYRRI